MADMKRRALLKQSACCAFAAGAAASPAAAINAQDEKRRGPMGKCRITVIETTFNERLANQYGAPNIGRCPMHKAGDTFITDFGKPAGLCDEAWASFGKYVFALSLGVEGFWPERIAKRGVRRVRESTTETGGEGGIRTHGPRKGSTVFETARFNHSRTSPRGRKGLHLNYSGCPPGGARRAAPVVAPLETAVL